MPPLHPFEQQLAAAWPPVDWRDLGLVLAVSGGADSVALARALATLKTQGAGRLTMAHFNHRLRGAESDADCAFVQELSGQLALDCVIGHAEASGFAAPGDGLEAAARKARYEFLQHAAEARGARYVVAAHTADDQAETVLHHVLRGTGLAGLAGMARTRPLGPAVTLIRPMLHARRHEVVAYLASLDQPFREDTSNQDLQFMRNRIRHDLLPRLARDVAPAVVESLVRLAKLAGDAQRVVELAADRLLGRAVVDRGPLCATIDCDALAGGDRHLVRELFVALWRRQAWPMQEMGYAEWDLLADMALGTADSTGGCASSGTRGEGAWKRVFPGAIVVQRLGGQLSLLAPSGPPSFTAR